MKLFTWFKSKANLIRSNAFLVSEIDKLSNQFIELNSKYEELIQQFNALSEESQMSIDYYLDLMIELMEQRDTAINEAKHLRFLLEESVN